MKLCECGCGREVKNRFVRGHTFRGKHFTEAHRGRIGEANKGRDYTEETRRKLSEANKGKLVSAKTRRKISKANTGKHRSVETRTKISLALTGRKFSDSHRLHLKESWINPRSRERHLKGLRLSHCCIPHSKKQSKRTQESWRNPDIRKRHEEAVRTPSYRQGRRVISTRLWRNPEYREKTVKATIHAQNIRPNIPEQKLIGIIRNNNFPFIYVGDGKIVIEGFCPDFIDNNGSKRIIEVFGDYWHRLPKVMERDEKRLETFRKYGFKTLVIWVSELKDEDCVVNRIKEIML